MMKHFSKIAAAIFCLIALFYGVTTTRTFAQDAPTTVDQAVDQPAKIPLTARHTVGRNNFRITILP